MIDCEIVILIVIVIVGFIMLKLELELLLRIIIYKLIMDIVLVSYFRWSFEDLFVDMDAVVNSMWCEQSFLQNV
jgi:hypothetical protein